MNTFQKMIGTSILIISLSVAYYFVIYIPKKDKNILEQKKLEQSKIEEIANQNRTLLTNCLEEVSTRFSNAFKEQSGNISNETAKIIIDFSEKQKNDCFKKYPQ